jgi:hypothetical protein
VVVVPWSIDVSADSATGKPRMRASKRAGGWRADAVLADRGRGLALYEIHITPDGDCRPEQPLTAREIRQLLRLNELLADVRAAMKVQHQSDDAIAKAVVQVAQRLEETSDLSELELAVVLGRYGMLIDVSASPRVDLARELRIEDKQARVLLVRAREKDGAPAQHGKPSAELNTRGKILLERARVKAQQDDDHVPENAPASVRATRGRKPPYSPFGAAKHARDYERVIKQGLPFGKTLAAEWGVKESKVRSNVKWLRDEGWLTGDRLSTKSMQQLGQQPRADDPPER